MLLRRITKHVKDQNWFAVFIDFLIVVTGILIAFQITNWSDAQSNKVDAQEYLQRLMADMEMSTERNAFQISTLETQVTQLDIILQALESCLLSSENKPVFGAGLYNMGKYDSPTMVMGTIDEMNATGKFNLISDLELRRLITSAVREHKNVTDVDPQILGRTIPSINYVRSHVRYTLDMHLDRPETIDPDKVIYNFDELCVDKNFINAIATVREMTIAGISLNKFNNTHQVELLEALKDHLGMSGLDKEE